MPPDTSSVYPRRWTRSRCSRESLALQQNLVDQSEGEVFRRPSVGHVIAERESGLWRQLVLLSHAFLGRLFGL